MKAGELKAGDWCWHNGRSKLCLGSGNDGSVRVAYSAWATEVLRADAEVEPLPPGAGYDYVPFKLEVGKRYVLRNKLVTDRLERNLASGDYPFMAVVNGARQCWAPYGKYEVSVPNHSYDIVAEYVEPEPKYRPFSDWKEWWPHRERWVINKMDSAYTPHKITRPHVSAQYLQLLVDYVFINDDLTEEPFGVRCDK